ncbi:031bdb73-5975-4446-a97e-f27b94bc82cc [Thermothielavioides terrestris]|uniref:031bdb73-5975-4446-a97e-f27b94bc82cc n=1 Tax=Thermothielavioides terrestris TaxID=2587410 RepID=A0A3S4AXG3_9PEZI|nr:031bdb73-5975-4446-a97e-f27b94bc82cc [Thermothielavioides terrestris]
MAMELDDQYFIFENRLDSFRGPQPVSKGRVSSATSRAPKAMHWPHKTLSPVALAKAGFFFDPHPKSPDNVVCFLCAKSLTGWEEHDNPVEEHLKHSPTCGWAIMAAIEAGYGNYGKVHPLDPAMIEARKATFAGRWPYESKKGFKCKTKKLVEGGWKYTPSLDADDMTTCAYCNLALEGWESDDNPFDEHYRREPGCPFFALLNQYPAPKKGRAKAARASKASRLSVQSVATVATAASDLNSAADITADHDDSVLTTVSTMTQGGKRTTRVKKAASGKKRKTKVKKDEAIEILEDEPQVVEAAKQPATKGRKRASDAMEDAAATNAEAPALKKRATRVRGSVVSETPSLPDTEMVDVIPPKQPAARKRARASTTKPSRKVSRTSLRSQASTASLRANLPDDDEIERQLEADLERYHSDAEDFAAEKPPAPARGRPKKATTARKTSAQRQKAQRESYAMFDPTPVVPDEAEIEAEFEALKAEMEMEETAAPETLAVPKQGRKAGTRKASKQTKKVKEPVTTSDPAAQPDEDAPLVEAVQEAGQRQQQQEPEPEFFDDPDASSGTVASARGSTSEVPAQPAEPPTADPGPSSSPRYIPRKPVPVVSQAPAQTRGSVPFTESVPPAAPPPPKPETTYPVLPSSASRRSQPATPRRHGTPSRRASQAAVSPLRSPQSSDAENRPPPLRPAASIVSKRVVLAPLSQTPLRASPSRRNIVAGLQSTTPWRPADLDLLFSSPAKAAAQDGGSGGDEDKENDGALAVARLLRKGAELTSPEKRMTVEEWIYHNAGLAELKLRHECEAMVSAFEREGSRAMSVLEGLVVE